MALKLSISFIQCDLSEPTPQKNLINLKPLILKTIAKKPKLIMLPEVYLNRSKNLKADTKVYKEHTKNLLSLSQKHNVCFYGSLLKSKGQKIFNSAFFISPKFGIQTHYNKIHLFTLDGENKRFDAGSKTCTYKSNWGDILPMICYDLRFPETFRKQVIKNRPKIILLSAQWPRSRKKHWVTLLQARAIENQAFVIACNRTGTIKSTVFKGNSLIISPFGKILKDSHSAKTTMPFCIDLSEVNQVRKRFPFLPK